MEQPMGDTGGSQGISAATVVTEVTAALRERFGDAVTDVVAFRGEETAYVTTDVLVDVIRYLRDDQCFNHLSDVTAVDRLGTTPRFEVVYHLFSLSRHIWYRIKVRVDESDAVPSLSHTFPCANWAEREVYDLFGLVFDQHPQLHRILMPEGWVGHPLRKDYPMSQITLPRSGATKIPD